MKNRSDALYHCIDNGELIVIAQVTIHSVSVNLYRCLVCGKQFDDSEYESIASLEDCVEIKRVADLLND